MWFFNLKMFTFDYTFGYHFTKSGKCTAISGDFGLTLNIRLNKSD